MTTGKVKTLFTDKEKTEALFPRTKLSAVSDENGVGLDALMQHLAYTDEKSNDIIINTIDADSLNGVPAKDWAQKSFVTSEIAKAQFSGSGSGDVNLDGFATKDDLSNIDFPVDSVNGKTGNVQLSAADVGALSTNGGTINGSVDMNGTVTIKGNLVYSDGDINMNSRKVWNLPTPTGWGDAANKGYVDDGLATKAPDIGKGVYTGDVNIVGDNGVPINSVLWVSQATNLPSGHQWGVLETWQPQPGAILQRFSSSDRGVFWREYFHNGVSSDWHVGWQRLDNTECAPAGYGLGGGGVYISDCNTTLESGFYKWDINCANSPFDYATMIVSGRHGDCCNQIAICNAGSDRGKIVARAIDGSGASPWIPLDGSNSAPSKHNHSASDVNSGTFGVARGGTGKATHTSNAILTGNGTSAVKNVATASGALYATAANGAAKFGTLPIAQGGTGATTAADALKKLGLTATATELNYTDGVTSNIQEQLNNKLYYDQYIISNAPVSCQQVANAITAGNLGSYCAFVARIASKTTAPAEGVAVGCIATVQNAAFIFMDYSTNILYKCILIGTTLTIKEL